MNAVILILVLKTMAQTKSFEDKKNAEKIKYSLMFSMFSSERIKTKLEKQYLVKVDEHPNQMRLECRVISFCWTLDLLVSHSVL